MPKLASLAAVVLATLATAAADPVPMRLPEGPTHGFLAVTDASGTRIAEGELVQWLERAVVASRLTFRFNDGSSYDELVRFTQRPVFRVVTYRLRHDGPSFTETLQMAFDARGRYRVRRRAAPDEPLERRAGHMDDLPADVSNGIVSILLKNLVPDGTATTHVVAFTPDPVVLELRLVPEGIDSFRVGGARRPATRYRVQPHVPGVKGLAATVIGKQPEPVRMWIARGPAPTLVRFRGALYTDGPVWRVGLTGPRWDDE